MLERARTCSSAHARARARTHVLERARTCAGADLNWSLDVYGGLLPLLEHPEVTKV